MYHQIRFLKLTNYCSTRFSNTEFFYGKNCAHPGRAPRVWCEMELTAYDSGRVDRQPLPLRPFCGSQRTVCSCRCCRLSATLKALKQTALPPRALVHRAMCLDGRVPGGGDSCWGGCQDSPLRVGGAFCVGLVLTPRAQSFRVNVHVDDLDFSTQSPRCCPKSKRNPCGRLEWELGRTWVQGGASRSSLL